MGRVKGEAGDLALVNINVRVPRQLWRRVKDACAERRRKMQNFITETLREYLDAERRRRR